MKFSPLRTVFVFCVTFLLSLPLSVHAACTSQAITAGQTVNGTLSSSDCVTTGGSNYYYYDKYTFSGTAGQQIYITNTSSSIDVDLTLFDPDSDWTYDDDGGSGSNARIPADTGYFTLPLTGTYEIFASSYIPSTTGSYTLLLTLSSGSISGTTQDAVEYYHGTFNHYFVTAAPEEAAVLDAGTMGWTRTGQTYKVNSTSGAVRVPVCRFFSTSFSPKSSHFYTANPGECATVKSNANWQYEGDAFYVMQPSGGACQSGTIPLYRIYNNGYSGAPNHRYTTCTSIRDVMLSKGWVSEGIGMCVAAGSNNCATDASSGGTNYLSGSATNGVCGSAHGTTVTSKPSTNLCSVGSSSSVTGSGPWYWSCAGSNGGSSASCSASKAAATLSCPETRGYGTNGVSLYTPDNWFTYYISNLSANAAVTTTVGWGAANSGSVYSVTGSLKAVLWASATSHSGGTIYGTKVGEFIPQFTGSGAYSSSQLRAGGYSTNTITSSTVDYNPPAGQYCIVLTLTHRSSNCSASDGYCIVDWIQFEGAESFH